MIPKRIFYVWGVNDPKKRDVLACMQSWRQVCPDYEIIEINEDSKKYFDFAQELKSNRWFRTVYERQMWAYVADYVRIKTLYENGGIYLDTDVTIVKPLDKFLKDKAFVGIQDSKRDGWQNYVEPAILGACKGNAFLKKILDFYDENSKVNIWNVNFYTMPEIFQYYLEETYKPQDYPVKAEQKIIPYKDITIYPERYFIPFRYKKIFTPECVKKDTHTIHWFGGSWLDPDILYFLENKHLRDIPPHKSLCYIKLWGVLVLTGENYNNINTVKLFNFIPLIKRTKYSTGEDISFLGFIPLLKIKMKQNKTWVKLFNFIPLLKIKRKM